MMSKNKTGTYFELCNKWLYLKNIHVPIKNHPRLKDKTIAVYGLGKLGKRLLEELQNDDAEVAYAVDRNFEGFFSDIELYTLKEKLPPAEIMIITPVCEFEEIKEYMQSSFLGTMISLEEIIDDLWKGAWENR
jgi:lactate dehydrogenase-like 2-hydroxyacid dehydrogenase